MNKKKHIDTIKNYHYNSTISETDKITSFEVGNHSHHTKK